MQFTISQDQFARALNRVCAVAARVAPHRDSEDITTHVLMEVKDSTTLEITASDLSMEARVFLKITGGKKGTCTANAATLNSSVGGLPAGEPLEVSFAGDEVKINCIRAQFSLVTLPANDYGGLVSEELAKNASRFTMPPDGLRKLLLSALPCAADDETRYYLTGVYLHIQGRQAPRRRHRWLSLGFGFHCRAQGGRENERGDCPAQGGAVFDSVY